MKRRRFLQVAAAALLPRAAQAGDWRWQGVALGAEAEVVLRGEAGAAQRVLAAIPPLLARIEREFSLYRADSALVRLNAAGRLASPSPAYHALCALTDVLHKATDGIFDPTVQPLWRALADGGDVAAAARATGWRRVRHDGAVVLAPGQALTFNGIAQGFATDAVRALLARHGFDHALINIGEFAALGGPFALGVADPVAGMLAQRQITGGAVATSSPGAMTIGGRAHILHPQGLAPLWSSVTVEADTAALADGLSTALVFAPRAAIPGIRARLPGVGRITLVDSAGDLTSL
ncbi:FAD:protein FMN transferase [Fertoebacter nigrum]|uniref:FAD:protein FMN transferase n=1 Tax=Fertoeibacter niger TaxID=2656921 RepID=A0A8X8KPB1_9RHOB|nr:FAD:protein FMN transferase [Fertoeibacter niger]NUB42772.1 FAD:protein FMN transferase [Fertoeibacter niger]